MAMAYYFNNAACAYPLTEGVAKAVVSCLSEPPQVSGRDAIADQDRLFLCREKIAELLGTSSYRIVLTNGATSALNTAILGIGLKRGDLVVTSVMEHNSVLRPLAYLEDRSGVEVAHIPLSRSAELDGDVYDKLLAQKPHLVVLTHASNVTGRINPIKKMFEAAKSVGAVTLLDASQTVGRIPVNVNELHADMIAFPGYKGLRGTLGAGALYVSNLTRLEPVFTGGTGIKSDVRLMPDEMPLRLEAGTQNTPAFSGLCAAVEYCLMHIEEIVAEERKITESLMRELPTIPNVRLLDAAPCERLPVVSFIVDGVDTETVGYALTESFSVICRTGLHCAPLMHKALGVYGSVRLSPSYINSPEEIEYVLEAVRKIAR